jgi:hypothetical protein
MSSKGGKHVCARGGKKSHVALKCCWKGKVLLICTKTSKREGRWSTMNLTVMIELQGSNSLNILWGGGGYRCDPNATKNNWDKGLFVG